MKKKKVSKTSRRRLVIFGSISFICIAYFLFLSLFYIYNVGILLKSEKDLKKELTSLEDEAVILKSDIEKLKDDDYIARYARENYGYSKDGEIIIQMDDDKQTVENLESYDYEKAIKFGIYVITFIIGYVILKALFSRKKNDKSDKRKS